MENTITFLGTAGARFMVANQIRASGGMWLSLNGTQILVDPGPGSIVQATKRKLKAHSLKAIILTHRHLDHSGDLNIMVEAMTNGGFQPHGRVFLPQDALTPEPVLYSYLKPYLDGVEVLQEGKTYSIDGVSLSTPLRHIHTVETYGLKFSAGDLTFSYITDTRFFEGLITAYQSDIIIMNIVFTKPWDNIDHLSLVDAELIINGIKPKAAVLTHFGMSMWKAKPWEVAEQLSQKTGIKVISARDGMVLNLDELKNKINI